VEDWIMTAATALALPFREVVGGATGGREDAAVTDGRRQLLDNKQNRVHGIREAARLFFPFFQLLNFFINGFVE
jgi:hypothetical protein